MIDKLKTGVLSFLVALSLFQTYLLAYNKPDILPVNPAEYIQTDLKGTTLELAQLVFPKDIVVHLGEGKHTLLYPEHLFYDKMMESISEKLFIEMRSVYEFNINTEKMRNAEIGLEFRFHTGLPFSSLQEMFLFEPTMDILDAKIDRIWISNTPGEEAVRALLFTENGMFRAEAVDFSAKELLHLVSFAEYLHEVQPYHTDNGNIYLPDTPVEAVAMRFKYTVYTSEQLRNSLFVDPGISRSIMQQNGEEIIMDGKRGLQINHNEFWMNYFDPAAPVATEESLEMHLQAAIQFVNQHGGWNGTYALVEIPRETTNAFRFLQYLNSFPIVSTNQLRFGTIQVAMKQGVATGYERSLLLLERQSVDKQIVTLPGGDELKQMLRRYDPEALISVFPAYAPTIGDEGLLLTPRWAVELQDGHYELLR